MKLKCECGGTFERATLKDFDFSAFAGLPSRLRDVPGLRCPKCGAETIDGKVIAGALDALLAEVVKLDPVLAPEHVRFIRKRLGLTQQELAEKMGLQRRETVTEWELGKPTPITPAYDFVLRTLAYKDLAERMDASRSSLLEYLAVHTVLPPVTPMEPIILNSPRRRTDPNIRRN